MALSPAQKQKAYRDRKRAVRDAVAAQVRRISEAIAAKTREAERQEQAWREEAARREREAEEAAARKAIEAAERAEAARIARGIEDGTLSPDGDPWRPGEPVVRPNTPTSPRALMEAGRKAALQQAVDSFIKTGALAVDEFGPRERRRRAFDGQRIRYDGTGIIDYKLPKFARKFFTGVCTRSRIYGAGKPKSTSRKVRILNFKNLADRVREILELS